MASGPAATKQGAHANVTHGRPARHWDVWIRRRTAGHGLSPTSSTQGRRLCRWRL